MLYTFITPWFRDGRWVTVWFIIFYLSVHCDEFRRRAHAHLARSEAGADGPGLRFGGTEPGRQEASARERYQAFDWSVIQRYGDLSPRDWS